MAMDNSKKRLGCLIPRRELAPMQLTEEQGRGSYQYCSIDRLRRLRVLWPGTAQRAGRPIYHNGVGQFDI